ncbi:MAG: winged helix-turn-helix transcriptional regulator [Candidatus Thermoplasmatota archaeon]|nr:winged helix-turn-helix transcriptional regulator [Candidatus Thermoplasmatota archaeon]
MTIDRVENQAGIFRIMITLTTGDMTLSELLRISEVTQRAAYRSLYQLTVMGWMEEEQLDKFPFTRTFRLTEKGKKAAKIIRQLEKLTDPSPDTTIYDAEKSGRIPQGWTLRKRT